MYGVRQFLSTLASVISVRNKIVSLIIRVTDTNLCVLKLTGYLISVS